VGGVWQCNVLLQFPMISYIFLSCPTIFHYFPLFSIILVPYSWGGLVWQCHVLLEFPIISTIFLACPTTFHYFPRFSIIFYYFSALFIMRGVYDSAMFCYNFTWFPAFSYHVLLYSIISYDFPLFSIILVTYS